MNRAALSAYFLEVHRQPARLGGLDCVRFVVEAIHRGWGEDLRPMLGYRDRRTAVDRLRMAGGLREAFEAEFGPAVDVDELVPGDVAYFQDGFVGLVMPDYVAVKVRRTIFRTPPQLASAGWHTWVQ